jgi:drug/metabolite transporter (DMT)-like permease
VLEEQPPPAPSNESITLEKLASGSISTFPGLTRHERWWADASLMVTAILWGINIPVVKFATAYIDALVFNAARMAVSTVVLGVLALVESKWIAQPAQRFSIWRLLIFALVSSLWYPLMFMWGIDRTTAGNTALLLSSMPLWTAMISAFFISERLPLITWLALVIAFIGTAIVVAAGGKVSLSAANFNGNILILSSAFLWASGTVISGPLLKQISPLRLAFFSSLLTTPMHLWLVGPRLVAALPRFSESHNLWALIYSGAFSTGIAYATWHVGVRKLGGSHAAVYQNVVTLVAVLGGWLALNEPMLGSQLVGGVLMIAGLLLMRKGRR